MTAYDEINDDAMNDQIFLLGLPLESWNKIT